MDMCAAPPENESQLVQYKGAPRITVPPADDSPLSYREDTLVSVFNDIYNHFINLFYIPPERVVFPPAETGRHLLDVAYLRDKLRLAPRVISLLERLPYVDEIHHGGTIWYPSARMVDYRDNKKALEARDPSSISWKTTDALGAERSSGPNVEYMRSMDIALAFPDNGFQHIILDTEAKKDSIRLMADWCELPSLLSEGPLEVPEHVDHYRNHAGYHAPSLLRTYYEDLLSLEIYPFRLDDMIGTYNVSGLSAGALELQLMLPRNHKLSLL
ncbi:uncharacterized protein F5Z01DRAFT_690230 [Emericellopsis atlantica]|uniref:Uncharacterized protein n=1 Tax=Emericellopsis atlantica TaxID=2614577 RepID=A0A9P7ZUT6_9HYPO|nr:uncharacterized protein F5Z01DRAFT_690230 [Emericellopsis atlantica]KAG9258754.1 hypothetical protein F5Z01DRAFT_690230 [Emericellopsis atlantica]